MFHDRPFARVLLIVASALGFCVAQSALAQFPEDTVDPGAPPSEAPDHSGELFNFGSTFIFSFSRAVGDFVPSASIDCTTCAFPVAADSLHTFRLTGRVLGQVRGNNGAIVSDSAGVYDMDITITGAKATVSQTVTEGVLEQTITYRANLTAAGAVSGELVLDVEATPRPQPLPDGTRITVDAHFFAGGADKTPFLEVGANPTFPAIPASSPLGLGQGVPENVVFQITQRWRGPVVPPPPVIN